MENEELKKQIILEIIKKINNPFKLLTVNEVAKELHIGINQAYELFKQNDFPTLHIGKKKCVTVLSYILWKINIKESDIYGK